MARVLGERAQQMLGVEAPAVVDAAGRARIGEGGGEEQRVGVAHRHDQHRRVGARETHVGERGEVERRMAAVAAHGALGPARGARGVHQRPQLLGLHIDRRLGRRGRRDQVLVGLVSLRRDGAAEVDVAPRRDPEVAADAVDAVDEVGLHDAGLRLAVVDDVGDLAADEAEVDRHHHQPGLGRRRIDLEPLDRVVGEDRDPIAALESEPQQPVGEPAGPLVPLPEGHRSREVAGADPVRVKVGIDAQRLAHVEQSNHVAIPSQAQSDGIVGRHRLVRAIGRGKRSRPFAPRRWCAAAKIPTPAQTTLRLPQGRTGTPNGDLGKD